MMLIIKYLLTSLSLSCWSPVSAPTTEPRPSHRVPSDQLLLAGPKDSQKYTIKILTIDNDATDLGSLEAVATCCDANSVSRQGLSQQVTGDAKNAGVISVLSWVRSIG